MTVYKITDTINLDNNEKEVGKLTLDDLYEIYEKHSINVLVKIVGSELELLTDEED